MTNYRARQSGGQAPDFRKGQEASFRRLVREVIRKGPFTKSERDVTLALVDQWFHHKGGPKPYIHPGREKLAKRAGCTVKTVSRTLGKLSAAGIAEPLSHAKGGRGKATTYRINLIALLAYCGCNWLDEFARMTGPAGVQNVPVSGSEMSRFWASKTGTKCPAVYNQRASCTEDPIQDDEISGGVR